MPKSSPRLKLKTVQLSHSFAFLPFPKRSVIVEGIYRTVERDLKEIVAEFKKVMYPPEEPYYSLTTEDRNKIMKSALYSRYYSKPVKNVIAEAFNDNVVSMKWTYEFADTETLYWNIAYYWDTSQQELNEELVSLAVKNPNFDYRCMKAFFVTGEEESKRVIHELKDEFFTDELMLWLLSEAWRWGLEKEVGIRVSRILGLPETTPLLWLRKIIETQHIYSPSN